MVNETTTNRKEKTMKAEYLKQVEYRDAHDAVRLAWSYLCKCVCKSGDKYDAAKAAHEAAKKHLASLE